MNPDSKHFPSALHDRFIPAGATRQDQERWVRATVGGQRRMTYGNFVAIMIQFLSKGGPDAASACVRYTVALFTGALCFIVFCVQVFKNIKHPRTHDWRCIPPSRINVDCWLRVWPIQWPYDVEWLSSEARGEIHTAENKFMFIRIIFMILKDASILLESSLKDKPRRRRGEQKQKCPDWRGMAFRVDSEQPALLTQMWSYSN